MNNYFSIHIHSVCWSWTKPRSKYFSFVLKAKFIQIFVLGRLVTDKEILSFGASWCFGKKTDCEKKIRSTNNRLPSLSSTSSSAHYPLAKKVCKLAGGNRNNILEPCESKLSFDKYYKACKMDMSNCPNNKCYCESLLAYSRECERLGIELRNWQKQTGCDPSNFKKKKRNISKSHLRPTHRPKLSRNDHLPRVMTTSNFNRYRNLTKTLNPVQFNPPLMPIPIDWIVKSAYKAFVRNVALLVIYSI